MTTTVTIKALHGWPVDVTPVSTGPHAVGPKSRVPAGQARDYVVHSGQDLLIHEVQPGELAAETTAEAAAQAEVAA